jgi:hypothetical protein
MADCSHASPLESHLAEVIGTNHQQCTVLLPPHVFQWKECLSRDHELIIIVMPPFDPLGKVQPLHVGLGGHYMSRWAPAYEKLGRDLLSEIERFQHCLISKDLLNFRIETLHTLSANNFR